MMQRKSPTIYDVARLANISPSTVSRALSGTRRVAAPTWRRIEEAVAALDYRPNSVARGLAARSTSTIAILLPDITVAFFPELVKQIQLAAEELGYTLFLCNTQDDPDREIAYLDALRRKQVDGLLLVGLAVRVRELARLVEGVPVVCLDPDVNLPGASVVQINNEKGARTAMEHLLGLGHRHIAHIAGLPGRSATRERMAGYRKSLRAAGILPDPALVEAGDFTELGGYRAGRRLLDRGAQFTAVFAANDQSAIGAMTAFRERGLEMPGALSVVGFDDIRMAAHTVPPLTTIREPAKEIGRRATELLAEMIRGGSEGAPVRVRFDGELVVRRSSAPPRA